MNSRAVSVFFRCTLGLALGTALTACTEQSPGGTAVDAVPTADLATAPTPLKPPKAQGEAGRGAAGASLSSGGRVP
jgi:hypothetical protein